MWIFFIFYLIIAKKYTDIPTLRKLSILWKTVLKYRNKYNFNSSHFLDIGSGLRQHNHHVPIYIITIMYKTINEIPCIL